MVLPQDGGIGEGQRYLPTGAGDAIGERTGARTEKRRNRGGRNTGGRGEDKHGESGAARRRSPVVEVLHRDYHVQHGSYTRADEGAGRCRSGVGAGGRGEVVPSPCGGFFFFLRDPRASNLICIVCLIFSTDSSEHFKTGLIFRQLFKSIPGLDKYFVITTLNAIALINATLKNLNNALTAYERILDYMDSKAAEGVCADEDAVLTLGKMRLIYRELKDAESVKMCLRMIVTRHNMAGGGADVRRNEASKTDRGEELSNLIIELV
mmetsp:Transcript_20494/g.59412  ORF Transcript_20494/g.59412 Transcript_20494/m.59412 type:complete len:265 (+) Transcript_20494:1054-1848(+)